MASISADSGQPKKKGTGIFKALKLEFQQVKTKWDSEIKVFYQKPPFPARVTRTIPRTSAAQAYDVDELRIRLWFDGPNFEELPVRVEVLDRLKTVPKRLADLIAIEIEEHWKAELTTELSLPEHLRSGWLVQTILEWCEDNYGQFLQLEPSVLEGYLGFDHNTGMTSRRYALIDPEEAAKNKAEEDDSNGKEEKKEATLTEEEIKKNEERIRKKQLSKQKNDDRERELKRVEAQRKKDEAIRLRELGVDTTKFKQISKKEKERLAALKGKGIRTAKTGSRRTKYAGPGSALDKAATKKKKKT